MGKLVWRAEAVDDLEEIISYIAERNRRAAEHFLSLIEDTADRLLRFPEMHRPGRVAGTREAVIHPNYILVYRLLDDRIEIVTLLHSRQQYP